MKSTTICLSASLKCVLSGSGNLVLGCPGSAIEFECVVRDGVGDVKGCAKDLVLLGEPRIPEYLLGPK